MSVIAWINGKFIDPPELSWEVQDRGFLYGDGLFETIRVDCCCPLYWKEHLARIRNGCAVLGISFPAEEVDKGVGEACLRLENGVLRLTVTRGKAIKRGLLPVQSGAATAVITGYSGEPYPEHLYNRGFKSQLISFPRSHLSPLVKFKSINCLENILGKKEADLAGADEGIFCNYRGEIAEGTTSNIFLSMAGKLLTPPVECGLLPGIMRARVLLAANRLGLTVAQEKIYPLDFRKAEESFLTNSLLGIMPMVYFNGYPVGSGRPGKLTKMLRRKLQEPGENPERI